MFRNGLYNLLTGIVRLFSSFIAVPILVHQMGIRDYGVWALISSILGLLTLAEAGLPIAATVYISRDLSKGDEQDLSKTLTIILSSIFVIASVSAILLYCGSTYLFGLSNLFSTFSESEIKIVLVALKISSLSVWLQLIQQVFVGIEQAYQPYQICCTSVALQLVCLTVGWVFLSLLGFRVIEFVWWLNFISLISFVFHVSFVAYIVDVRSVKFLWDSMKAKEIGYYGFMSWVTVIGRILFTRGDRLVIASSLGAESLSLYSIFSDFSVAISGFSSMLIQPITPVISNELTLLGSTSYKLPLIIRNAMRWSFLSALFLGLSMLIISPLILKLCGDSILSYENLLGFRLLISITTVISLSAVGYWFLFASREVGISMVIYLISGFISLVLIYLFSSSFGLIGAITGNIGYAGTLYLSFLALKRVNMKSYQLLIYLAITVIVIFSSFLLLTIAKI